MNCTCNDAVYVIRKSQETSAGTEMGKLFLVCVEDVNLIGGNMNVIKETQNLY
jgi:hypothetical protein